MLISGCALSAGTLQAARTIPTTLTIGSFDVSRTAGAVTRARLCGIAAACASSADSVCGSELAASAAVVVRVVANSSSLEFTRRRIAALVVATSFCAAAVAVLTLFDNPVSALLTCNGGNLSVVRQATAFNAIASKSRANVADGAGAKLRDTLSGRGVHDEFGSGVAGARAERTALLRADNLAIGAGLRIAVVYCTKRMAGLVGNDLPFGRRLRNDIGSAHRLPIIRLNVRHTKLAEP